MTDPRVRKGQPLPLFDAVLGEDRPVEEVAQ